jgi:hypothetical protein
MMEPSQSQKYVIIAATQNRFVCVAAVKRKGPPTLHKICNWPQCGCDPHANKVIESLSEQGLLKG